MLSSRNVIFNANRRGAECVPIRRDQFLGAKKKKPQRSSRNFLL